MIIEIIKPRNPTTRIPRAEICATLTSSFLVGFFRTIQTRLHFSTKDFNEVNIFIE